MLAALVPFRPSTVVHVIETPILARFLVGLADFLLLDSEASACKHAPSLGIPYTGSWIGHPGLPHLSSELELELLWLP